jgi:hypothetical protein
VLTKDKKQAVEIASGNVDRSRHSTCTGPGSHILGASVDSVFAYLAARGGVRFATSNEVASLP